MTDFPRAPAAIEKPELVVLLHGAWGGRPDHMDAVRDAVTAARPNADIIVPVIPGLSEKYSIVSPQAAAVAVADTIDAAWRKRPDGYERIVLIGFSAGGLIARKVAILAHGEVTTTAPDGCSHVEAPFEAETQAYIHGRPWAANIERITLLAGINRGISIAGAADRPTAAVWLTGYAVAEWIRLRKGAYPTMMEVRRGSPFLVQTRLQWLALVRSDAGSRLLTVQLIGAGDTFLPVADEVDFSVNLAGGSFRLLELPGTNHANCMVLSKPDDESEAPDETACRLRWRRLVAALRETPERLDAISSHRDHSTDETPQPDSEVQEVIFASGDVRSGSHEKALNDLDGEATGDRRWRLFPWGEADPQDRVRGRLEASAARKPPHPNPLPGGEGGYVETLAKEEDDRRNVRFAEVSYGYLAWFPSFLPWVRYRKTEWLMDRYVDIRARFPEAEVGYASRESEWRMSAAALKNYPAVKLNPVTSAIEAHKSTSRWRLGGT